MKSLKIELQNNITIHNFYVPAGGDIADIKLNPKFKHKIDFLQEMVNFLRNEKSKKRIILGDFNIAPFENDVWSHKSLLNIVSHTKIETNYFNKLLTQAAFEDIIRKNFKNNDKIFSWWSYRNKDWQKSRTYGVTGVPTYIYNNHSVVGAQPIENLVKFLNHFGVPKL